MLTPDFSGKITLSSLGIDEFEAGICEDTSENRQILRANSILYRISEPGFLEVDLRGVNGGPSRAEKDASMWERNKSILVNPRDKWSDYLPFTELPFDWWDTAPFWAQRHMNKYNDAVAAGVPDHKLPTLPTRCKRMRGDGHRCWAWSWPSPAAEGFCRFHAPIGSFDYANQFQKLTDAAKGRLVELQSDALDALEELVTDRTTVPHVRLKAAENILDRTGIRAGTELTISGQVTHEVQDPAQAVRERLNALAARLGPPEIESSSLPAPIIDVEVVETDEIPLD